MNPLTILSVVQALIPVGVEVASLFIHNVNSQNKFSVIISDVETILGITQQLHVAQPAPPAPKV